MFEKFNQNDQNVPTIICNFAQKRIAWKSGINCISICETQKKSRVLDVFFSVKNKFMRSIQNVKEKNPLLKKRESWIKNVDNVDKLVYKSILAEKRCLWIKKISTGFVVDNVDNVDELKIEHSFCAI